jgi:hypothetical protein
MLRRVGEHLLALLIVVHLVTSVVTGVGKAPTRSNATDRALLQRWSHGDDALEDRLVAVGASWNEVRGAVQRWVRPYGNLCGTRQTWRMFAGTHKTTVRLEIAVRANEGAWSPVWIEGSDHDPLYDYYRFRQYRRHLKGSSRDRLWKDFVAFAADRTLEDHPGAAEVRIRAMRARIRSPGDARRRSFGEVIKSEVNAR